jgi:hypothetical protein
MDVLEDHSPVGRTSADEHSGALGMDSNAPETTIGDGFDTLGLSGGPGAFSHTEDAQQEMEQFLLSAGVEVAEDHGMNADTGMNHALELAMEGDVDHIAHGAMMDGMMDLDTHEMHVDGLHHDTETHHEPATFDLHEIHQELHVATSLHDVPQESANASNIVVPSAGMQQEETATHTSLSRTLFDVNLSPSPSDRGLHPEFHLQEEPVPTGVQIVNEEVLVNDIGLSPLGEGLPSTEALEIMKQEADLLALQVSLIRSCGIAAADRRKSLSRVMISSSMRLRSNLILPPQKWSRHRRLGIRHYPSITLSQNLSLRSTNCSSSNLRQRRRRDPMLNIDRKKHSPITCRLWTLLSEERSIG